MLTVRRKALLVLLLGAIAMFTGSDQAVAATSGAGGCNLCTNMCGDYVQKCRNFGCGNNALGCDEVACTGVDGNQYEFKIDCNH